MHIEFLSVYLNKIKIFVLERRICQSNVDKGLFVGGPAGVDEF